MRKVNTTLFFLRWVWIVLCFLCLPSISIAAEVEPSFLVISDAHLDTTSRHVMDISPSSASMFNDLDESTFVTLIKELSEGIRRGEYPKPAFIIYLGDVVGHIRIAPDSVQKSEAFFFKTLTNYFPGVPIFYTFGNNDSFLKNYGPFSSSVSSAEITTPLDVARSTEHWLGHFLSTGDVCSGAAMTYPCTQAENTTDGYYSAYLEPGFRLIALNTVMFSTRRIGVGAEAVVSQLNWLSSQLRDARVHQESVLISMHIPPGNNVYDDSTFWTSEENMFFLNLMKEYQHTVVGVLAGHTHKDEVKVIQDSMHQPIAGIYLIAALSTSHGNSPSARWIHYSKDSGQWQLTDHDIVNFVKDAQGNLLLNPLYDFAKYYCVGEEKSRLDCLNKITAEKMATYFNAGNKNFPADIRFPNRIKIELTPSLSLHRIRAWFHRRLLRF